MTSSLYNLARMSTATTGTGTITLLSAVAGFLSFADADVQNGDTISYSIIDGILSEVGTGVYTAAGTTLTRSVLKSTNSDAEIELTGNAEVTIAILAEDFDANVAAIGLNTTHRGSAGTDHSDVGLANTHRGSDGSDHSFLDQSVISGASPTFNALTITSMAADWTNAARTIADLGIVTTVDINGGSIDGAIIGAASAVAGSFAEIVGTDLIINGNVLIDGNANENQLRIQYHVGQTEDGFVIEKSDGTDYFKISGAGLTSIGVAGTPSTVYECHIQRGSADANARALLVEEGTTSTNGLATGMTLKTTTTGNMSGGFGGGFAFAIEDTAGVENFIGIIYGVRDGADNSGMMQFHTYNAGSRAEKLRIDRLGNLTFFDGGDHIFGTSAGTKFGTATAQKMGWWDATPVVQQVLATGGGATVDNVISLLQTLGLCKQS